MKQECLPLGGGIKNQVDSNTNRITSLENQNWIGLKSGVAPSTVTKSDLQTDVYDFLNLFISLDSSNYYVGNIVVPTFNVDFRVRINLFGGWYINLRYNTWSSSTPLEIEGYDSSGASKSVKVSIWGRK